MITYVNNVFVSNVSSSNIVTTIADAAAAAGKGKFILWDIDADAAVSANTIRFKIGMGTGKGIKWSNVINVADIKGWSASSYAADTEDTCYIDFSGATGLIGSGKLLSKAGKRIIVRLTFKDMPTRFRKWTESYEYITKDGDTAATIAASIAAMINGEAKRARVIAKVGSITTASTATSTEAVTTIKAESASNAGDGSYFHEDAAATTGTAIQLVAMKYDDDESVDSINWYNKVRFNANMYYTDPAAEGWESLNKHFVTGAKIEKVPGKTYEASAKLVRDREAQAMGYDGILNRGEGTWPIIKPGMNTVLDNHYNVVTIEFENMYRTADDLFRKTKQTVEIYTTAATSGFTTELAKLTNAIVDDTIDK